MTGEIIGIAFLFFAIGFIGWLFWIMNNNIRQGTRETDIECRFLVLEQSLLDKIALKRGFNLEKQIAKIEIRSREKLRKKLYEEMIKEMFPDKEKEITKPGCSEDLNT